MEPISSLLSWLLRTSWQTSILVLILILVQGWLGRRLAPRWQYGLWLLVIARALLPAAPSSAWSVFNLTGSYPPAASLSVPLSAALPKANVAKASRPAVEPGTPVAASPVSRLGTAGPSAAAPVVSDPKGAGTAASADLSASSRAAQAGHLATVMFLIWLAGLLWMGGRILIPHARFRARLRGEAAMDDPAMWRLLRDCGQVMNLRFLPRLIRTRAVLTPALHGYWRPCLLLPEGTIDSLSATEWRYVFLHELAHIKRRDMPVLWLMTFVKALHWFNPLFWIAAQRLSAACELACDHGVLARLRGPENRPYGATIVRLLEPLTTPAPLPGLIGIAEDKGRIFERIAAIRDFKKATKISLAGLGVLALVAVVCLTDARRRDEGPAAQKVAPPPVVTVALSHSNAPFKLFISDFHQGHHYHFILPDGTLWLWDMRRVNGPNATMTPIPVGTNTDWVKVQTFQGHCVALRRDGALWEWGEGMGGVLSNPPAPLNLGSAWKDIAVGRGLLVGLKQDGTLWGRIDGSWFAPAPGRLPSGMCQIGADSDWVSVGGGKEASGPALRADGSLWTWDLCSWSTNGSWTGRFLEPTQLGHDSGWRILDSYAPALVVSEGGIVWDATTLFDRRGNGELTGLSYGGDATPGRFALIPGEGRGSRAGRIHDDGTLWESAYASDPPDPPAPQRVGNRADWVALWGTGTVLGLTADGTLWTWGGIDLTAPVVFPPPPSRIRRAYWQLQHALGGKPPPAVRSFPCPRIKEPRPMMRLVPTPPP